MTNNIQTLQDIYAKQNEIAQKIQTLQLTVLPHVRFIMIIDRIVELNKSITDNIPALTSQLNSQNAQSTINKIGELLTSVHQKSQKGLKKIQDKVDYNQYASKLIAYKKQLREHAADLSESLKSDETNIVKKFGPSLTNIDAELECLSHDTCEIISWAEPQIVTNIKTIDRIFKILEQAPTLSELKIATQKDFQRKAYGYIKKSDLFDTRYYISQLGGKGANLKDPLLHYLKAQQQEKPNLFFSPEYYFSRYEEVGKMRYDPLEHFIRYGELLYYNPIHFFDTHYYLSAHEDVLDAQVSPFRHFIYHGTTEGRQPSLKSGSYFASAYMEVPPVKLLFIGEPDQSSQTAWRMLSKLCENGKSGQVEFINPKDWTGKESNFNSVVLGESGSSHINKEILHNLSESDTRILYIGSYPETDLKPLLSQHQIDLGRICAVCPDYNSFLRWQEKESPLRLHFYPFEDEDDSIPFITGILNMLKGKHSFPLRKTELWQDNSDSSPRISVVSIIYKKSKEMIRFLEALNRQDIAQKYEVILVDDASPDDSVEKIEHWLSKKKESGEINRFMDVRILRNKGNMGNCTSRNRGIQAARADIVLIADGDVVLSTCSLAEHLWMYRYDDCDAVTAFWKFDMEYAFVFDWLAAVEVNPQIVRRFIAKNMGLSKITMRSLENSIFTFVTRNVSIKKSSFNDYFFDELFNYTSDRNSGYGSEDHEIAARIYFNGKNIRFLDKSVCVHMRHGDNSHNADKALSNLRNWNRLMKKHPDLKLIDRQYYQGNVLNLLQKTSSRSGADEVIECLSEFSSPNRANVSIPQSKQLKILTCNWNEPYQYELCKMDHMFSLVTDEGHQSSRRWDYSSRPRPYNLDFIPADNIDPALYDMAIIPFDKRALVPGPYQKRLNTMLELSKSMKRIALCHELPIEGYKADFNIESSDMENQRKNLRNLLMDTHVVLTSTQEQQYWNFAKSSVIWHGFSPQEYPSGRHDQGYITFSDKSLKQTTTPLSHNILNKINNVLPDGHPLTKINTPLPHPGYEPGGQEWAVAKYQAYGHYIGRFAVHLTPFKTPAMPRLRTEAMLTGVIPLTIRSEDTEMFIQNGVNGFYGESAEELTEHAIWLMKHEEQIASISRNARLSAMDIFNIDRFVEKWTNLILKLI